MICYCGQDMGETTAFGWLTCQYNQLGEIIYATCMHGIVCIDINRNTLYMIEVLEDLKMSCQNHGIGLDETEIQRTQNRIEALDYVINLLKKELK